MSACTWRLFSAVAILLAWPTANSLAESEYARAIGQIKPSIVAVGTFERLRNPEFQFRGTGFAVGDGTLIATNDHVIPKILNGNRYETIAIAVPEPGRMVQVRAAREVAADPDYDLALLKIKGSPLPALRIGDSHRAREGDIYLFTGFPIGPVLGLFPVTNRAMISAITPIVIPAANAEQLKARSVRRIEEGTYPVFQLDGTAYPGNSGSPLYNPKTDKVMGIVNMVFVKGTKEAALSEPSGISYAIPAEYLKELLSKTR